MADEFEKSVQDGISLSKRVYFGKDRSVAPPKPMAEMLKSQQSYLPTAPMVYAVIPNPEVVDNPDIPSYQPHVHGRLDPPALIPLQMNAISAEAECYLDTAFVTITGSWRVYCVMASRQCDCRIAIPIGEQGSILGVEVDAPRKSYTTQLVAADDIKDRVTNVQDGAFLKSHIFTFTIPQISGGSNLSVKVRWSQKLLYQDGQLTLKIPFSFPEFVTPAGKKMSKKEKIQLDVNSCPGTEVLCKTISHPLKELRCQGGKLGFLYESEVLAWSCSDFMFTYGISTNASGGVILQSPSILDVDRREMFCLYIFPGRELSKTVLRKEIIFVVDISGSMRGKPLEDTKNALVAALSKLDRGDSFNVIAFNDEIYLFSSSLELATEETIGKVNEWIGMNFVAGGGTNMLLPLNKALEMFPNIHNCAPIIFLITDGAVEDERHICDIMKSHLTSHKSIHPRLYTFGIGFFCNHYFLRMLAIIGRGYYDAAYDADSIEVRMKGFFTKAFSTVLADISIDSLDNLDVIEVYPSHIPDLLSESPFIISGRYRGDFPIILKVRGILADMKAFTLDLKVQEAKDIPVDKLLTKQHIEMNTAQAWFSENVKLNEKIAKHSVQSSVISEYTQMVLLETERGKKATSESAPLQAQKKQASTELDLQKIIVLPNFGFGFGNLTATAENTRPGSAEDKLPESAEVFVRATSDCCGRLCGYCCCMCCIKTCSRINDQFAIALTQLCGALSCLGCYSCCEACCGSES